MDDMDFATDRLTAEVAAATEAVQSARDFIAGYVLDGEPCGFKFKGRPSHLLDKLEGLGVDLDAGRYGRTWEDPAGNRQFFINNEDEEIRALLKNLILAAATR
jgi:hypothetical protein